MPWDFEIQYWQDLPCHGILTVLFFKIPWQNPPCHGILKNDTVKIPWQGGFCQWILKNSTVKIPWQRSTALSRFWRSSGWIFSSIPRTEVGFPTRIATLSHSSILKRPCVLPSDPSSASGRSRACRLHPPRHGVCH